MAREDKLIDQLKKLKTKIKPNPDFVKRLREHLKIILKNTSKND